MIKNRFGQILLALTVCSALCLAAACSSTDKNNGKSSSADASAASSGDNKDDNEKNKSSEDKADSASADESSGDSEDDVPYKAGEKLSKLVDIFSKPYTYTVKTSYSDDTEHSVTVKLCDDGSGDQMSLLYTVNDETAEDGGKEKEDKKTDSKSSPVSYAFFANGEGAVDVNYDISAYAKGDKPSNYNIVKQIVEYKLDKTNTHIPEDTQGMTVEEYTYTGDSYITVLDFFFDDKDELKKYVVTYQVEGQDDVVQTSEVLELKEGSEYEEFVPVEGMKDFDAMTEDERLGFCQKVCGDNNISTDDMYKMGITTDDLKKIEFHTFTDLYYNYRK